jgi:hypothetical protein
MGESVDAEELIFVGIISSVDDDTFSSIKLEDKGYEWEHGKYRSAEVIVRYKEYVRLVHVQEQWLHIYEQQHPGKLCRLY